MIRRIVALMDGDGGDQAPPLPDPRWALFSDVDGTLTTHVEHADAVVLDRRVIPLLLRLDAWLDGALALVSGRSIASLDALFHPSPPRHVAGLHGLEWRPCDGDASLASAAMPREWIARARAIETAHSGARVEAHGACLYLHWRAAPTAATAFTALAGEIARAMPTHRLHPGAHGIEIRPEGMDKGEAIRRFMTHAPFAGRTPVYAGDDPADEPGFIAVNDMGGISVRVGPPRRSAARFALPDSGAVLEWLSAAHMKSKEIVRNG